MKPGRELDDLVCKYILNFTYVPPTSEGTYVYNDYHLDDDGERYDDFSPSQNIADAWLVVEKMKDAGIEVWWDGKEWHCEIGFDEIDWEAEAETAPLAICLAALKAVGVEVG